MFPWLLARTTGKFPWWLGSTVASAVRRKARYIVFGHRPRGL